MGVYSGTNYGSIKPAMLALKNKPHVAYYYQKLSNYKLGLESIARSVCSGSMHDADVIVYLASFQFGQDPESKSFYMHLNDSSLSNDTLFESLGRWCDTIQFRIMIGGAGGAFGVLFESQDSYIACYALLHELISKYRHIIEGVDLDVEEPARVENIKMFIRDLKRDFGISFAVTMAPVSYAMETDSPGLGGFVYKDIYTDPEVGSLVDCFNVQCYQGSFTTSTFQAIVNNGYAPQRLAFGMLGSEYAGSKDPAFEVGVRDYCRFRASHTCLQGVVLWELGDSRIDPVVWGEAISAPHYFLTDAFIDKCEWAIAEITRMLLLFMCHMLRHVLQAARHFFYMLDTLHVVSFEMRTPMH